MRDLLLQKWGPALLPPGPGGSAKIPHRARRRSRVLRGRPLPKTPAPTPAARPRMGPPLPPDRGPPRARDQGGMAALLPPRFHR
eukprot:15877158-Heterocapsa_arctica.AAC.1